ncbi:response regulator transcription factor [Nitrospira sp. M1]
MRVLVVEDDHHVARQLAKALSKMAYAVDIAHNGEDGEYFGQTESYDAVILDLGLPKKEGLTILQHWRKEGRMMPILVLTARDTWREKVTGLRAGADDYLTKPFEMEEVVARVEALIRRATGQVNPVITWGSVKLDTSSQQVFLDNIPLELTALEFRTLSYFLHHPNAIISKTRLTEHIYNQDFDLDSNVIEVLVNRLRKKLGTSFITTHRGKGYQLTTFDEHT